MIHLHQRVWRFRMAFWKSSHADSETALIRMTARFVERFHGANQVNGMTEVSGLSSL